MAGKIYFLFGTLFTAIILTTTADPIASNNHMQINIGDKKVVRSKRQSTAEDGEYRDCDANPPYLPPTAIETGPRLQALRDKMAGEGLAAYIIPSEDAHQSEYIAERDTRREYISGFSGSAGLAIVTEDKAALWTDGRYFLEADMVLDCNWILQKEDEPGVPEPEDWLVTELDEGDQVGFDPTLMSISGYNRYNATFESVANGGPVLKSLKKNLIDEIWGQDTANPQPDYPDKELLVLDWEMFTGETWQDKIWKFTGADGLDSVRSKMMEVGAKALVISKLDEIAWIFNLRGQDIPYNPMFVSYAIITEESIQLYLYDKEGRLDPDIKTHLGIGSGSCTDENVVAEACVTVRDYSAFLTDLDALESDLTWISDQMSYAIYERVPETTRYLMASPILLMKAVKSPTEIAGMNNAHLKDSIALCRLGNWMQETIDSFRDPEVGDIEVLSELGVENKAYEFRSDMDDFEGLSFRAISGFGPNGAVIHYSSSEETNVAITNRNTFLFDSGSQYKDGTVDITRTFHFGKPTDFMIEAYTRVLLGHIDLALGSFRNGVYGRDIDAYAREPLWRAGLDYKHGTGHGIGHFLNVHEEPARIRIGYRPNEKPLELGMFQSDAPISVGGRQEPMELGVFNSDEPGYYEDNSFGIRIEDIMYTVEAETEHKFSGYTYMTWKMCSLVPLEPVLIDFDLFSPRQIDWYNAYNKRIRDEVGPRLEGTYDDAYKWMMSKTGEISYSFTWSASTTLRNSSILLMISAMLAYVLGL